MSELMPVRNHLICNVQALGNEAAEDCSSPLVSDGYSWSCPYGHIQGYDGLGNIVRKIPDRRASVRQGHLNREIL
jgi:hypothetical protein